MSVENGELDAAVECQRYHVHEWCCILGVLEPVAGANVDRGYGGTLLRNTACNVQLLTCLPLYGCQRSKLRTRVRLNSRQIRTSFLSSTNASSVAVRPPFPSNGAFSHGSVLINAPLVHDLRFDSFAASVSSVAVSRTPPAVIADGDSFVVQRKFRKCRSWLRI